MHTRARTHTQWNLQAFLPPSQHGVMCYTLQTITYAHKHTVNVQILDL